MATTIVSGTTNIEDALIYAGSTGANYGGLVGNGLQVGNTSVGIRRQLFRCASAAIPQGSLTAWRLKMYRVSNAVSVAAGHVNIYAVKDANAWVEGTASGSAQSGSCTWLSTKHLIANWAGHATADGCGVSGTDYDADASPPGFDFPSYITGADTLFTVDLTSILSVAQAWRDGTRTNNGLLLREAAEDTVGKWWIGQPSEAASNQPTFEFDYIPMPLLTAHHDRKRRSL